MKRSSGHYFWLKKDCSVNRRWFITRIIKSYWRDFSLQCTVKGTDYFSFLDNCHRFWMFPDVNGLFCFLRDIFFLQQKGKVRVISISLPTFNWTTWQIYDVFIYYICSWFRHLSSVLMSVVNNVIKNYICVLICNQQQNVKIKIIICFAVFCSTPQ